MMIGVSCVPKGYVYLVGAGPGDPKLLTIKGAECIKAHGVAYFGDDLIGVA